jgi:uncharacterized protein (DUF362 family)
MIPVGLARTEASYSGLRAPWGPGKIYPELLPLLGETAAAGPFNPAYAAVRAAFRGLGLDAGRFGTEQWNPLGALVRRGQRVVLKPNFIRHWNPLVGATVDSVVTHGSIVRAAADYAFLAVGTEGSVAIAEAPQHDCDFARIREIVGLDALARFYEDTVSNELEIVDLRREAVVYRDGIIVERIALPGDPQGYRVIDLGPRSFFQGSGLDPDRFRGADYDPSVTTEHHSGGRNEYLLSETVLKADLVLNLPKLKTHKKTGVTLAMKNLVGINGDKNWLPHHSLGPVQEGGDEFPEDRLVDRLRSRATEVARHLLARGRATRVLRLARRLEWATRGEDFVRSGNWWGNQTCWRMCVDLNRCLYYSDAQGLYLDARSPVRKVLTLIDGIVAGEGGGPLAPQDVPLGVVLAATDPVALDLVALRVMGFDERFVPKVREAMVDEGLRVTEVRQPSDVTVFEVPATTFEVRELPLDQVSSQRRFVPHPGWLGHIERARL